MKIDFSALQSYASSVDPKSNSKPSVDKEKYLVPTFKVNQEVVFSLVWEHKHKVQDDHPFVPVVTYRLKDSNSKYGSQSVVPESSFDETLVDPVNAALENLKRIQEKNTGDSRIPTELWKSFLPTTYNYVPVVVKGSENEGVKWLRLSPTTLKSLFDLMPEWYDEATGKLPDFRLKKSNQTTYDINAYPPTKGERAIDTIDKGILQDSLDNLPPIRDLLYVHNDEQVQKAIKVNIETIQNELTDESEVDHGSQYKSSGESNVDSNLKTNLDSIFG